MNRPGRFEASYASFSGSEIGTVRADAGETLIFKYDAQVNKGTLSIKIEDPGDQILWDMSLDEGAEDTVKLPVEQSGLYIIVVHGDDTRGSFDLSWEVE